MDRITRWLLAERRGPLAPSRCSVYCHLKWLARAVAEGKNWKCPFLSNREEHMILRCQPHNLALRGLSVCNFFFLFFLHPLVVYCARRITRQLWECAFVREWQMWARWKENLSASLRVKQCVRLWWMKARQTWLFVYVFPKMCQKSRLISDSASACNAGSSCLDLSQHVTVTEAKMKDLIWQRSWPPTCVFSQLSSCFGPNLAFIHIACWGLPPTPFF